MDGPLFARPNVGRYAKLEKYDIQLRIRIQTLAIIPTICAEYILVMVKPLKPLGLSRKLGYAILQRVLMLRNLPIISHNHQMDNG